jgi:hypothetical protein
MAIFFRKLLKIDEKSDNKLTPGEASLFNFQAEKNQSQQTVRFRPLSTGFVQTSVQKTWLHSKQTLASGIVQ